MSKYKLNAFYLQKYTSIEGGNKHAVLTLTQYFGGLVGSMEIGSIKLDEEDINYLLNKYKISELEQKEIEQDKTLKKLNELQDAIKFLKGNG